MEPARNYALEAATDGHLLNAVRVIGPEAACRKTLARMDTGGIPMVGFTAPLPAEGRDDVVRFYAFTDPDTARQEKARRRDRRGRGGRQHRGPK